MSNAKAKHICHRLFVELATLGDYPLGVSPVAVNRRIPRTAFFPGGYGLWNPDGGFPALPPRPVVVVGHNWGTPADHDTAFTEGIEYSEAWPESTRRRCTTWYNLLPILRGAGIAPDQCFFTNAYMGLKSDGGGNIGELASTPEFERRCRGFLGFQLTALAPSVVLALGKPAIKMLGQLVPALGGWLKPGGDDRTLQDIRRRNLGLVPDASVDAHTPEFVAVPIAHTCDSRNLSEGFSEEIELLRAAVEVGKHR